MDRDSLPSLLQTSDPASCVSGQQLSTEIIGSHALGDTGVTRASLSSHAVCDTGVTECTRTRIALTEVVIALPTFIHCVYFRVKPLTSVLFRQSRLSTPDRDKIGKGEHISINFIIISHTEPS